MIEFALLIFGVVHFKDCSRLKLIHSNAIHLRRRSSQFNSSHTQLVHTVYLHII